MVFLFLSTSTSGQVTGQVLLPAQTALSTSVLLSTGPGETHQLSLEQGYLEGSQSRSGEFAAGEQVGITVDDTVLTKEFDRWMVGARTQANNGTALGNAQVDAGGKVCHGAKIPKNELYTVTDGIATNLDVNQVGNTGTISFWYKPNNYWRRVSTRSWLRTARHLIDAGGHDGTMHHFTASLFTKGAVQFGVTNENGVTVASQTPELEIASNTWAHVALTWRLGQAENNRLQIFVDGVKQAEEPTSSTYGLAPALGDLVIGDLEEGPVIHPWIVKSADGQIDEFRVYDFEQSAAEINSDRNVTYSCGSGGTFPSSKAIVFYQMEEPVWSGTPGEIFDASGDSPFLQDPYSPSTVVSMPDL